MVTQNWANTGSGNGLLPDSTKPLPKPILTYHQWGPMTITCRKFHESQPSVTKISNTITNLKFHSNLPWPNELISVQFGTSLVYVLVDRLSLCTSKLGGIGPVQFQRSDDVTSIPANGCAAFIWKLHSHWLESLRQHHITVVIKASDSQCGKSAWTVRNGTKKTQ